MDGSTSSGNMPPRASSATSEGHADASRMRDEDIDMLTATAPAMPEVPEALEAIFMGEEPLGGVEQHTAMDSAVHHGAGNDEAPVLPFEPNDSAMLDAQAPCAHEDPIPTAPSLGGVDIDAAVDDETQDAAGNDDAPAHPLVPDDVGILDAQAPCAPQVAIPTAPSLGVLATDAAIDDAMQDDAGRDGALAPPPSPCGADMQHAPETAHGDDASITGAPSVTGSLDMPLPNMFEHINPVGAANEAADTLPDLETRTAQARNELHTVQCQLANARHGEDFHRKHPDGSGGPGGAACGAGLV